MSRLMARKARYPPRQRLGSLAPMPGSLRQSQQSVMTLPRPLPQVRCNWWIPTSPTNSTLRQLPRHQLSPVGSVLSSQLWVQPSPQPLLCVSSSEAVPCLRGFVSVLLLDKCSCYVLQDRKSTRLNSSHRTISYAVFC